MIPDIPKLLSIAAISLAGGDLPDQPCDTGDDPPTTGIEIDIARGVSIQTEPSPPQPPPCADAAEPDELAELEQFLADIREAMEPDSHLEDDLAHWKE